MELKTDRELIYILFEKLKEQDEKIKKQEKEIAILKTKQYVSNVDVLPEPYEYSYKDWLNKMTVTEEHIKYILDSMKIDFVDGFKNYIEENIDKSDTEIPLCFCKKKLYILEKVNDVNVWKLFDKEKMYNDFITPVHMKLIRFLDLNKDIYEPDIIWEKIRLLYNMKKNLNTDKKRDSIVKWMKKIAKKVDK